MYRQVAIAAYKKQKNLPDLVKNFRKQKFINSPKNNNSNNTNHSTDDQFTKYLEAQFNNSAWNFSNNLPTKDFSIWKKNSDAQQIIFRQQEIFLLTLCREQLQRNPNYRTFNNVPPPKPFYQVDNFAEAKFLALCWLLRETDAEKIINTCEPTPEEIKRLKALEESMKKIQHREQEKTRN
jgi:hypothetical protein